MAIVADNHIFIHFQKERQMHYNDVEGSSVHTHHAIFFQRLSIIAKRETPYTTDVMEYEMCTLAQACSDQVRATTRLSDAIYVMPVECKIRCCNYVIDDVWLLQTIQWEGGQ